MEILSIFNQPTSLDDGYRRAKQLAHDWQLDASSLDTWYQAVKDARKRGARDRDAPFPVSLTGKPLGPDGPTPYARIDYSFDEQNPALLDFELQWVPGA